MNTDLLRAEHLARLAAQVRTVHRPLQLAAHAAANGLTELDVPRYMLTPEKAHEMAEHGFHLREDGAFVRVMMPAVGLALAMMLTGCEPGTEEGRSAFVEVALPVWWMIAKVIAGGLTMLVAWLFFWSCVGAPSSWPIGTGTGPRDHGDAVFQDAPPRLRRPRSVLVKAGDAPRLKLPQD